MAKNGQVDWYGQDVILAIETATRRGLEALAAVIDGQTKINIVANDQVDTGFMVNSVYYASEATSTYNTADPSGNYPNKRGDLVQREMAPEAKLIDEALALVCVGANYAIYQEMATPFLYPALLAGVSMAGGTLQTAAKEDGLI